jgi:hypothetical protein
MRIERLGGRSNSAMNMAGGGRHVQRETLKAFGLSSRQVVNPRLGADRRTGLDKPLTWKNEMPSYIPEQTDGLAIDHCREHGRTASTINRRRFLLNTTMAGAAVAVAAPVAAAEPEMTPHEKAVWHMRELERLAYEDGAAKVTMIVIAYQDIAIRSQVKSIMIDFQGNLRDDEGLFASKGGDA